MTPKLLVTNHAASPNSPFDIQLQPGYLSNINNITPVTVGPDSPSFSSWQFSIGSGTPAIYGIVLTVLLILILFRQQTKAKVFPKIL